MKFYTFFLCALVSFFCNSYAMRKEVKRLACVAGYNSAFFRYLPSAQIICKRLSKLSLDDINDFLDRTKFAKELGDTETHPLCIVPLIKIYLYTYYKKTGNPLIGAETLIIKELLKDFPQVLHEAEKCLKRYDEAIEKE